MKKKHVVLSVIALTVATLFIFSCEKEVANPEIDSTSVSTRITGVKINEGVLEFDSPDACIKAMDALSEMSEEEKDAWESELGFTSQRTLLNDIFSVYDQSTASVDENAIVEANSDIVHLDEDGIDINVVGHLYLPIITREGYFLINGIVHKVVGNEVIIAYDGSFKTAENALSGLKSLDTSVVQRISYVQEKHLKAHCGSHLYKDSPWTDKEEHCQLDLTILVQPFSSENKTYYRTVVQSYTRSKKGGKYKSHTHQLKDMVFMFEDYFQLSISGSSGFLPRLITVRIAEKRSGTSCHRFTWYPYKGAGYSTKLPDSYFQHVEVDFRAGAGYWGYLNCY